MKKYRVVFYFLFFFFHVSLFTFSLYIESHEADFNYLLKLQGYIGYMKYGTLLGLILVTIDYFMDKVELGKLNKKIDAMTDEINGWKAKLYDRQEKVKLANQTKGKVQDRPEGMSGSSK